MSLSIRLKKLGFDTYLLLLLATVALAAVLPVSGQAAQLVSSATSWAVALLFFLYGARLNIEAIVEGISNWRLQGLVLATTFVAFPILGIALASLLSPWLEPQFVIGLLYLSILPSTVQSSIAFTSIARGNVAAAVCAASVSNLVGVFITPILAGILIQADMGGFNLEAVGDISLQLLLPFILGQFARPILNSWIDRHPALVRFVDRGSILLIVYSAFSAGVVAGVWSEVDGTSLAVLIIANAVLLGIVMTGTVLLSRAAGLSYPDAIVLLFCGSKKSLASGLPMANILFAGKALGLIVLPLMLFHQIQLFACAIVAQRAAHR